jgi:RNA polymerase sigma-70 factor (TIGR02943 family)
MGKNKNILQPENWADRYADYLYNYAFYRVGNEELAKDLVQDTFMSGLTAAAGFEGRSNEKTWLVSILKRKIIDHFRKASNRKEHKLIDKDFAEGKGELPYYTEGEMKGFWRQDKLPNNWNIDNNTAIENEELAEIMQDCIGKLPGKWAAVFTLRMIEELASNDICKELDITPSNLWVILHRARQQLRECIEKNWLK